MGEEALDVSDVRQVAATGAVPAGDRIEDLMAAAFARALDHHEGVVADYIPALAAADADALGLCVVDVDGGCHEQGDTRTPFSIQSISKAWAASSPS